MKMLNLNEFNVSCVNISYVEFKVEMEEILRVLLDGQGFFQGMIPGLAQ